MALMLAKTYAQISDLRLLKWMVGGIYLMGLPSLWLLLRVAAKVGALGT
jgi:hypothetical protein